MGMTKELSHELQAETKRASVPESTSLDTPARRLNWRRHHRIPATGSATVFLVDDDGKLKVMDAEMRDASIGGIGICLKEFVPEEQVVMLELPSNLSAWGSIRYCNRVEVGYHAGIQFVSEDDLARISGLTILAHKLGYSDRR